MSTLDESAIRQLLPRPNTGVRTETQPPTETPIPETQAPTETPIPGTIPIGSGDALIFDPDENITYDPLQASRTTPEIPAAPVPVMTSAPLGSNVIDLETTPPPSGGGMGWKFWVILVALLMVVILVVFFVMRSSVSSTPQAQAPTLDNLYGAR